MEEEEEEEEEEGEEQSRSSRAEQERQTFTSSVTDSYRIWPFARGHSSRTPRVLFFFCEVVLLFLSPLTHPLRLGPAVGRGPSPPAPNRWSQWRRGCWEIYVKSAAVSALEDCGLRLQRETHSDKSDG